MRAADFPEQLGTKYKFWYNDTAYGRTLFKEGRPGTGENWAEKIACELAGLLGLPHAVYELAVCEQRQGVISRALLDFSKGARLVHGNEVLAAVDTDYPGYDGPQKIRSKEHTLRRVLSYFRSTQDIVGAPYGFVRTDTVSSALDVFIGYLMLDAWIANQDRHDQNWGLLRTADGNSFLAPTYDHGSSMGRNESDDKRNRMMTTKDRGQHINRYVTTARSAFFVHGADAKPKPMHTLEAFQHAGRQNPAAAKEWRNRLNRVSDEQIQDVVNLVPNEWMSDTAKLFTQRLLCINRARILELEIGQ